MILNILRFFGYKVETYFFIARTSLFKLVQAEKGKLISYLNYSIWSCFVLFLILSNILLWGRWRNAEEGGRGGGAGSTISR